MLDVIKLGLNWLAPHLVSTSLGYGFYVMGKIRFEFGRVQETLFSS